MDGTGSPRLLFENLEFTPIQPILWTVSTLRHRPGEGQARIWRMTWQGLEKTSIHVSRVMCVVYAVAIEAFRIVRLNPGQSVAFFTWVNPGGGWVGLADALHLAESMRPPEAVNLPPSGCSWRILGSFSPRRWFKQATGAIHRSTRINNYFRLCTLYSNSKLLSSYN